MINGVNGIENDQTRGMDMRDLDVADSVLDLVGNTPLVKLPRIGEQSPCPIVAKLETTNPGGSSKDRPALVMIDEAEVLIRHRGEQVAEQSALNYTLRCVLLIERKRAHNSRVV